MSVPGTAVEALMEVMGQAERDLRAAHEEICRLQGLDPVKHDWPSWSSQANTLRWFKEIRAKFDPGRLVPEHGSGP